MKRYGFSDGVSLGTQFIALSWIVVAVVVAAGSGAFLLWEKRNMVHELEDKGKTISFFVSQLAVDPFLFNDILKLDNITGEAIKEEEVVFAFFLDSGGKPVTSLLGSVDFGDDLVKHMIERSEDPGRALGVLRAHKNVLNLEIPVSDGSSVLGSLVLGMSMVNINTRFSLIVVYSIFFGIGIILCLSVSLFLMFRSAAVRPIQQIISVAQKIAAGDLRSTVDVRGSAEVMALSRAINTTASSLKEMIFKLTDVAGTVRQVASAIGSSSHEVLDKSGLLKDSIGKTAAAVDDMNVSTTHLAEAAGTFSAMAEETSSAIFQMNASIQKTSENAEAFHEMSLETTSSVEEMIASIETITENLNNLSVASSNTLSAVSEMNVSVKEVEKNADASVLLAEKVYTEASGAGMNAINVALEGIAEIRDTVTASSDLIASVRVRSGEIDKVLTVIDDVADETRLLALNAAILAAKAGPHGKGFAVVAESIRALAEKTAVSTTEIADLITSLQKEAQSSVEMTGRGLQSVERGEALFRDVKACLARIIDSSQSSTGMARMISGATAEESRAIKQITDASNGSMDQITHIADAASEQGKGSRLILQAAEKMKDVSRLVQTSAKEQSQGSRQIAEAMEHVKFQAIKIAGSADSQQKQTAVISDAMENIRKAADESVLLSAEMDSEIAVLRKEAENLQSTLHKFKV